MTEEVGNGKGDNATPSPKSSMFDRLQPSTLQQHPCVFRRMTKDKTPKPSVFQRLRGGKEPILSVFIRIKIGASP